MQNPEAAHIYAREAHPPGQWDETLLQGLFLVLSNFALAPVLARLLRHGDWATAANYAGVLVVSSLYHMCRAGVLCMFEYRAHRIADYLFVYRALVYTMAALVARPRLFGGERAANVRLAFYYIVMIPMTLLLLGGEHDSTWVPFVGFVLPLLVAVAVALTYRVPFANNWMWATLALALLAAGGTLGFGIPQREYNWAHTIWHTLVMLSLYAFVRATE